MNLLNDLYEDTNVKKEQITKITFDSFEIDKESMFELMENFDGDEMLVLDEFIFWSEDFKIIINKIYGEWSEYLEFIKIPLNMPKTIEKIKPDTLTQIYKYVAKDNKTYDVPFESEELKEEKRQEKLKRIKRKEIQKEEDRRIALDHYDNIRAELMNIDFAKLKDFSILKDKTRCLNRYIVIPNDFPLYEEKTFYKEILVDELFTTIDFYGYLSSKDGIYIDNLLYADGLFGINFLENDRRNEVLDELLENEKIYKTIAFSDTFISNELQNKTHDEIAKIIVEKLKDVRYVK